MANYKNRKPKSFKGCCWMCALRRTDGRRNHRVLTRQELRSQEAEKHYWKHERHEKDPRD